MDCLSPVDIYYRDKYTYEPNKCSVRCGKCIACMQKYSSDWALRCQMELKLHSESCCVTLTYDDEHCPDELCRKDSQDFLKRLRSRFPEKRIRYFGCGEYGSKRGRPHFHIILFGFDFPDKKYFKMSGRKQKVYVSKILSELWSFGYATIGDVTRETCFYTAKYLGKLRQIDGKKPPFCLMSLKPSIGIDYLTAEDFGRGYFYLDGKKTFIPRSFYQSLERKGFDFYDFKEIRAERLAYFDSLKDKNAEFDYSYAKSRILLDKFKRR